MHQVADILAQKGFAVHAIGPEITVLRATQIMNQHKIGSLIVMEDGRLVGIFTERDVLRRVVAEERNPLSTPVRAVMTEHPLCCTPSDEMDQVAGLMKNRRVRHVPVCDSGGRVLGMISIGDINAMHATAQEQTIHFLNDYIYGRA